MFACCKGASPTVETPEAEVAGRRESLDEVFTNLSKGALISKTTMCVARGTTSFPVAERRSIWTHFQQVKHEEIVSAINSTQPYILTLCSKQRTVRYEVEIHSYDSDMFVMDVLQTYRNSKVAPRSSVHGAWPFKDLSQLEVVGKGGFGTVYKAHGKDGLVAVKVSTCLAQDNSESLEAVLSSDFDHQHVLKTLRHVIANHHVNLKDIWLVMPYCVNGSLVKVIDDHHFHSEARVLTTALQIAEGMQYLHSMNVVHGDLTPANVLFDAAYDVKISDFGLSRFDVTSTIQTTTSGAPLYAAPEISEGRLNHASDVYSFGLLVWEMCHGHRVFGTDPMTTKSVNPTPEWDDGVGSRFPFCLPLVTECTAPPRLRPTFDSVRAAIAARLRGYSMEAVQ